jgi:hypothetical protein
MFNSFFVKITKFMGKLSVPCRPGTPVYRLQAKTKGRACTHMLPRATTAPEPTSLLKEDSGVVTCPKTPNSAPPPRRALALPCVSSAVRCDGFVGRTHALQPRWGLQCGGYHPCEASRSHPYFPGGIWGWLHDACPTPQHGGLVAQVPAPLAREVRRECQPH